MTWNGDSIASFERNIIYVADSRPTLFQGTTCAQKHLNSPTGCSDRFDDNFRYAAFENNLYWNASTDGASLSATFPGAGGGKTGFLLVQGNESFHTWKQRGHDAGSLIADPLFTDPKVFDFTLKPDSPALQIGIESLNLDRAGPSWTLGPSES